MSLFDALQAGDRPAVERALEERPEEARARNEQGLSPIVLGLYHRRQDLAELVATRLESDGGALDWAEAAALGRLDRIEELHGGDVDLISSLTPDGFTALHYAAFFGRQELLEWLLAHGADPRRAAENPMRVEPLHSAATAGSVAACRALLAAGADANAIQHGGFTPLMSAAGVGSAELVELLLEAGADPRAEADEGATAASLARERGHGELAARLESQRG